MSWQRRVCMMNSPWSETSPDDEYTDEEMEESENTDTCVGCDDIYDIADLTQMDDGRLFCDYCFKEEEKERKLEMEEE